MSVRSMATGHGSTRLTLLLLWMTTIATGAATAGGCTSSSKKKDPKPQVDLTPQQVQSIVMTMSDDVMYSVADACAQIRQRCHRPEAQLYSASMRLGTAVAAISAATSQNPQVGYVDLFTMVMLQRMALEDPPARATLEERDRRLLHDTWSRLEKSLWARVQEYNVTPQQLDELKDLILQWRADNPNRTGVTQVRLSEFAAQRQTAAAEKTSKNPFAQKPGDAPGSILRLLRLDPMQGLDPATRQLRETRLLAERMTFWAQRIPLILGWQIELTTTRLLTTDSVAGVLNNADEISKAADAFSSATTRMAASYERTLDEFPRERKAAIEQVDRAATTQVTAAIQQSAAALATERKAAIEQAGDEIAKRVSAILDRAARDVDAQSKRSIDHAADIIARERAAALTDAENASRRLVDRMANRLILVICLGAVAVACVVLAYRKIVTRTVATNTTTAAPSRDSQEDPANLPMSAAKLR